MQLTSLEHPLAAAALALILILLIITGVIIQGCGSATDSKAVSITPPVLMSPADGDTLTITIATFTWTNEADKFEIDDNGGFTSPNSYVVSGTQFSLPDPLQTNKWYYWRADNGREYDLLVTGYIPFFTSVKLNKYR